MMKIGRRLVPAVAGLLCLLASGAARAADDDCLEVGWIDQSGDWAYYRAWIRSVDENELHLKYDYNHGHMDLKVSARESGEGKDVYVFKGEWREERGRDGGKVRLVLEKGRHHAKGFYTNGDWGDKHFDLKLGDCTHISP